MDSNFKVAVCQMQVTAEKNKNLETAQLMIEKAVINKAKLVVLPEIFNSPYQANLFPEYAEEYPSTTTNFLSSIAKKHKICIIGGSIPERDGNSIYNTCYVFNELGLLVNKYRKIHLFDIDIPDKITFKESDTLSAGDDLPLFEWQGLKFGVIICYDCRFPELSRILAAKGAQIIFIPGAFNMTTGPLHWELLMRSRAIDNQLFVVAASPARNLNASYLAWGHSMIVDPWGTIVAEADEKETILLADIDLAIIDTVRTNLPLLKQRREDLYYSMAKS